MRIESLATCIIDFRERLTNAWILRSVYTIESVPLLFACNKTRLYVGPVLFAMISLQFAIPVS